MLALVGVGLAVGMGVLFVVLRRFVAGGVCRCANRLDGKTVVVTGANTGIGKVTAIELAKRGASVVLACRDVGAALATAREVKAAAGSESNVSVRELDLSDLLSVRRFATIFLEEEERLDILVNNAGIMRCPRWRSKQGHEMQFAVNHLGHFLLTLLLLPALRRSTPSRVVTVSSLGHKRGKINFDNLQLEEGYDPRQAYCNSKLCNILFTKQLAARLKNSGVTAVSLNPGIVRTELGRHMLKRYSRLVLALVVRPVALLLLKTPWQGAQTTLHCVLADGLASGEYFSDCKPKACAPQADDENVARRLWTISAQLCGLSRAEALE